MNPWYPQIYVTKSPKTPTAKQKPSQDITEGTAHYPGKWPKPARLGPKPARLGPKPARLGPKKHA
jgi:hypothetical protein